MSLFRSRFTRLALSLAILPTLIVALIGTLSVQRLEQQLTRAYDLRLNDEVADLSARYAEAGPQGLRTMIEARRAMFPSDRDPVIYSVYTDGKLDTADAFAQRGDIAGFTEGGGYRLRDTPLSPTVELVIASATSDRNIAVAQARRDAVIAVLACLGLGLIFGTISARRFAQRLRRINGVIDAVAEGDVGARIPQDQSDDELSALSSHVNGMLDRVHRLVATRKRISDQVAHEIRTPLSKLDRALLSVDKTAEVDAARRDVRHCVALLDGLLDVSALEAQLGDRAGFTLVDLSERARTLSEFYDALAEEKGVTLHCAGDTPCRVRGNADQIDRLVANLISNAVKFTPTGGRVDVATRLEGNTAELTVTDSGPGVPPDIREHIFKPFFRRAGSVQGHGLGLALARAVAERHDGQIRVTEATPSPGARFAFSLKAAS